MPVNMRLLPIFEGGPNYFFLIRKRYMLQS